KWVYPEEHVSEFIGARGMGEAWCLIRAGSLAHRTEHDHLLVIPSKSGFGPARGLVQNRSPPSRCS
ncbi:hypothetical protein A2U01_0078574, partial [Trifolium medium]|nr:hypothetical protein [Trifolium medium]